MHSKAGGDGDPTMTMIKCTDNWMINQGKNRGDKKFSTPASSAKLESLILKVKRLGTGSIIEWPS